MIRVLLADDHRLVREGLRQILQETPDIVVVDESSNGSDILPKIRRQPVDVVILDISMPGRSGLEVLKEIHLNRPGVPVLVLSMHPEEQYAIRVLKAGAAGYLTKESASEELISAIRRVAAGGKYIRPTLAEKLADAVGQSSVSTAHEQLSDRQFEIMRMLATGKTVSEIAAELSLSVKTISTYRSRILAKMNLRNNAEIMSYALKQGLID